MPDPSLIISAIIAVVVFYIVLFKPLFQDKLGVYFETDSKNSAFSESLSVLEMITELEMDFQMGKVSREDFDALSLEYKHQYLKRKAEEKD